MDALFVEMVTAVPRFAVDADRDGCDALGMVSSVNVPEDNRSKNDPSGLDPAVHLPDMTSDFVPSAL